MSSKDLRQLVQVLRNIAFEAGAERVDQISLSKHTALDVTIGGKKFRQPIPHTATTRGRQNYIMQLRRQLRAATISSQPGFVYLVGGGH